MASLIVVLIIYIIFMAKSFLIVNAFEGLVIERFGKYYKTILQPGITFIVPFFDKVRARIDLREQTLDIPPQLAITKDNVTLSFDIVLFYNITNPKSAVYEIQNLRESLKYLMATALRDIVGKLKMNDVLNSRDTINDQLSKIFTEAVIKWGCQVNRVEITKIDPPKDIKDALQKENSISKKNANSETYQYSTFFKQTIQPGDVVRVLKVDGSNITIEKID